MTVAVIGSEGRRAELAELVAELEAGFNERDPARLARHLTADAFAVNVFGATVVGREALVAVQREGQARMFGEQRVSYRIVEAALPTPDTALLRLRIGPESTALPTVALWVLVRRAGVWQVAAMQGTLTSA